MSTDRFANEAYYDEVYGDRRRPWLTKALELLADGEWHDRETIVAALVPMVPPGVAWRYMDSGRISQLKKQAERTLTPEQYEKWLADPNNYERTKNIEENDLIRRGQRGVVVSTLGASDRIERRKEGDRIQIRRRPMSQRLLNSASARLRSFAQGT